MKELAMNKVALRAGNKATTRTASASAEAIFYVCKHHIITNKKSAKLGRLVVIQEFCKIHYALGSSTITLKDTKHISSKHIS